MKTRAQMSDRRSARERKTFAVMLTMYCHDRHGTRKGLCTACEQLQAYARERLSRCPFQAEKPTCLKCPVHCYQPEMRQRVTEVMRYAGPRMPLRHPLLALLHLWTGRAPNTLLPRLPYGKEKNMIKQSKG